MNAWVILCFLGLGVGYSEQVGIFSPMTNGQKGCYCYIYCKEKYTYQVEDLYLNPGVQPKQCRRSQWIGAEANTQRPKGFFLPRKPGPGWCMEITGVVTAPPNRITINFLNFGTTSIVSHFDIRMKTPWGTNYLVINDATRVAGGKWRWRKQNDYKGTIYPFALNKSFRVKICAIKEKTFQYSVNGTVVATRDSAHLASTMTKIGVSGNINIKDMNIWAE